MSSRTIAYHLRPNKAVDRALFLDLLTRVGRAFNISDYHYYGFGGPFMEDFRAIHTALRVENMHCIERSPTVQARQRFNSPIRGIEYILSTASDFLVGFEADDPSVVWLDFTSPGELKQQLDDTRVLVSKLAEGDVFRVTLNAQVSSLREPSRELNEKELVVIRKAQFEERAGEYLPKVVKDSCFRQDKYPALLLQSVVAAANKGVSSSPTLCVQPLSAYSYSDGTPMLTATGIVLRKDFRQKFIQETRLGHWPFASLDWKYPLEINLPVLSTRERLALETLMPQGTVADAKALLKDVVAVDGIEPAGIASFKQFYRIYPEFVRVGA